MGSTDLPTDGESLLLPDEPLPESATLRGTETGLDLKHHNI